MYIRPSEICYSQDSICNFFDKRCAHNYKRIGETLDDICDGRSSIDSVPTISVMLVDGKWTTADNRRLWVFRHLERLGKCTQIDVNQVWYIPAAKMTSDNGGTSARVRGNPGGKWYSKPSASSNVYKPARKPAPIVKPVTKSLASSNKYTPAHTSFPVAKPVAEPSNRSNMYKPALTTIPVVNRSNMYTPALTTIPVVKPVAEPPMFVNSRTVSDVKGDSSLYHGNRYGHRIYDNNAAQKYVVPTSTTGLSRPSVERNSATTGTFHDEEEEEHIIRNDVTFPNSRWQGNSVSDHTSQCCCVIL